MQLPYPPPILPFGSTRASAGLGTLTLYRQVGRLAAQSHNANEHQIHRKRTGGDHPQDPAVFHRRTKQQIGRFDAEFLLDFFAEEVGAYFYNRGVYDAQAILAGKLEDLGEAIYQLERPTDFKK
ncbi:DUF2164 domain-containing protein [Xanthomonas campestris]|uniref:DUF2164 domain-containing protein n=1 Tax=Xanthomonas campestris TaxID=339 RepID=UPI0031B7FE6E